MVTAIAPVHRGRLLALCLLPLVLAGCQVLTAPPAPPPPTALSAAAPEQPALALSDETVAAVPLINAKGVRDFYRVRQGKPAWTTPEAVAELLAAIRESGAEGLNPQDYHLQKLTEVGQPADGEATIARELLLTDAFLALASHYRYGRLNLQHILPEWQPQPRDEKFGALLETALAKNEVRATLERLLPKDAGYAALKAAYRRHQTLVEQGGWQRIPAGTRMQRGDHGPRIALLRQRLILGGDLPAEASATGHFDADLQAAVQRFQARHGLKADGVVEQNTLKALNVPVERRLRQLATNLEHRRWLPREFGSRDIVVNIAGFSLTVLEEQQPLLTMKVVAGRSDRQTPIFHSTITHLVLNPTWEVPYSIATKDLLPKIRKNPAYLRRFGFRLLNGNGGNGGNGQEMNPAQIDWQKVTPATFRYHLSQNPGKDNFLGQVKFLFANPYSVYLHDTPSKNLFQKESRPFSSGCVRLEKPLELAALLLRDTPLGSREGLDAALKNSTRTVRLPLAFPVHLIYQTAWVDGDGTLQLRPDIYGYDRLIEEGLEGRTVKKPLPCIGGCGE